MNRASPRSSVGLSLNLVMFLTGVFLLPAIIQHAPQKPPLDIVLIVDNSCSMFPDDQRIAGCRVWGNDPDFLRIVGSDLFLARLGFGDTNADDYQVGVISMGDNPPEVVSELGPLDTLRDSLAQAIDTPSPLLATNITAALDEAYSQLASVPPHKPENLPAVVLFTDGEPYPRPGQSDAVIEALVAQHPDVPLFVMLLQEPSQTDDRFEQYVQFWNRMQGTYPHIRSYPVTGTDDIVSKYNEIVAILQNTIPVPPEPLGPGQTLYLDIGDCVRRLEITVIHERGQPRATVTIRDSNGNIVQRNDPGVQWSDNVFNPTDVIIVDEGRLDAAPRDDQWTIVSDADVKVITDRAGCYDISFVEPEVSLTAVNNQFLALDRANPSLPIGFKIKLVDQQGNPYLESQPLFGTVYAPDGNSVDLSIPSDLVPQPDGTYEFSYDLGAAFPAARTSEGRYRFRFKAGRANDVNEILIPIAQADLLFDIGRGPYIADVNPTPLGCVPGQALDITVNIGDLETAQPGSVQVHVLGGGRDVQLTGSGDTFTGSLDSLCQDALAGMACDATSNVEFRLRLTGRLADGATAPAIERGLPVQLAAAACPTATPTPSPTPVPTPTPTPTPIPDTDRDGLNDQGDSCIQQAEWSVLPYFGGCPPPIWLIVLASIILLGILAFIIIWLIPWILVHVSPPPKGHVLICRKDDKHGVSRSISSVGMDKRKSKVTIGGDRKDHIYVQGLKPGEFVVVNENDNAVLKTKEGAPKGTFEVNPKTISTSSSDVTLKISLDQTRLRC